ncbi:MAG: amino acid racemase [Candidatus Aminicenantes bacterium]|nr:amino acid racemase [Candidatus Aminicenantes bacterium]
MKKIIGILGGMGPEATVRMFTLIIKNTRAEKDQDHIPVLIYSNPKIPPRTDAIIGKGPDPTSDLIEGISLLLKGGADFIMIPCITAHFFLPKITKSIEFAYLSLIEESLRYAKTKIPAIKKTGILASTGTLTSRLFHDCFLSEGIEVIHPNEKEQEKVMDAIFGERGIKAGYSSGYSRETIIDMAGTLINRGAEAIIAGCTEIPLVLTAEDIPVPLIEPMEITAQAGILKAGYNLSEQTLYFR